MKYGIFVPSLDVASCCSTTSRDPSNCAGSALSFSGAPSAPALVYSVVGERNPLTVRKMRLSRRLVSTTLMDELSGRSRRRFDQPEAAGEYTNARPRTF